MKLLLLIPFLFLSACGQGETSSGTVVIGQNGDVVVIDDDGDIIVTGETFGSAAPLDEHPVGEMPHVDD